MALNPAEASAGTHINTGDLGPLAWVLDETRKSLEAVTKALRRFVSDAETARGVDLSTIDSGPLRLVRQQLHQVVGALEMVGQDVASIANAIAAIRPAICPASRKMHGKGCIRCRKRRIRPG